MHHHKLLQPISYRRQTYTNNKEGVPGDDSTGNRHNVALMCDLAQLYHCVFLFFKLLLADLLLLTGLVQCKSKLINSLFISHVSKLFSITRIYIYTQIIEKS